MHIQKYIEEFFFCFKKNIYYEQLGNRFLPLTITLSFMIPGYQYILRQVNPSHLHMLVHFQIIGD